LNKLYPLKRKKSHFSGLQLIGGRNQKWMLTLSFLENNYLFQLRFISFVFFWFQIVKFQDAFYAPPVVVVSPRLAYNNNKSRFSGFEPCNAVTAWVEVRNMYFA